MSALLLLLGERLSTVPAPKPFPGRKSRVRSSGTGNGASLPNVLVTRRQDPCTLCPTWKAHKAPAALCCAQIRNKPWVSLLWEQNKGFFFPLAGMWPGIRPGAGLGFEILLSRCSARQAGAKMCKNAKNVKTPALAPRFGNLGLMCNKEVRDLCGAGQGARPLGVRRCRWHPRAGQGAALACPDPPAPEVPSPIPPPLLGAGCGGFGVFLNWFIWFCSVPPLLSASCIVGLAEPRFHWGFCPYSRLRSARCDACASPEPTPCWGISERVIGAGEEASIPGGNYA